MSTTATAPCHHDRLAKLGLRDDTLTPEQGERLDRDGIIIIPDVLAPETLASLRAAVERELAREGVYAGCEHGLEAGTRRLSDTVNKGPEFDLCWQHPLALAAAQRVLARPFRLSAMNVRDPLPGHGAQGLHADGAPRAAHEPNHYAMIMWALDDFTAENGATRVVPGTHLLTRQPREMLADVDAPHPGQIQATARAGAAIIVCSHIWHAGMPNRSGATRRCVHVEYCARDRPQQLAQHERIRLSTWKRLSPAARWLLDVDETV